jgi:hypothetical protein
VNSKLELPPSQPSPTGEGENGIISILER